MMSGLKERSFSLLLATKCVLINPRGDLAIYFLPASAFFLFASRIRNDFHFLARRGAAALGLGESEG